MTREQCLREVGRLKRLIGELQKRNEGGLTVKQGAQLEAAIGRARLRMIRVEREVRGLFGEAVFAAYENAQPDVAGPNVVRLRPRRRVT